MTERAYSELMKWLSQAVLDMDPDERLEHYDVRSRQEQGLCSVVRARTHEFRVDEPAEWGTDTSANPAELALAALGVSLEVTCRVYADYLGIPAGQISTAVSGNLDVGAFLGTLNSGRPGFDRVTAWVRVDGADEARLEQLANIVRQRCPMLDVFTSAIPVDVVVEPAPRATGPLVP